MHGSIRYFGFTLLFLGALVVASPDRAAAQCSGTHCQSAGHNNLSASAWPFTEDIFQTGPTLPPISLSGPSTAWTVIETGCQDPPLSGQNLRATGSFNALLRAQVTIGSATAAAGARYEVQLLVDGSPVAWYTRRLRGVYPQVDVFASTAQNVTAGNHSFSVQARLVDSGTLSLGNVYITASGVPTTYPSLKTTNGGTLTLANLFMKPVTDTLSFTTTESLDLVVQGYFQINSGTSLQPISVAPFLDGVRQLPVTVVAVPPVLYDAVNVLAVIPDVPAGNHTLTLEVITGGNSTTFQFRNVEFVSFPAGSYKVMQTSTTAVTVDSATTGTQPDPAALDTACGKWTKLLEGTIPPNPTFGSYSQTYEGYLKLTGVSSGPTWAQLAFETAFFATSAFTDGGGRQLAVAPYADGAYIFGSTATFADPNNTETIQMWARKVNPSCYPPNNGMQGSFGVADRYFWVKHVTLGGACLYP